MIRKLCTRCADAVMGSVLIVECTVLSRECISCVLWSCSEADGMDGCDWKLVGVNGYDVHLPDAVYLRSDRIES